MHGDSILLNEREASEYVASVSDPAARNYLMLVLARIRMKAVQEVGAATEAWLASLPKAPLDVLFIVKALDGVFANRRLMEGIARGEDPAELTGWDV